MNWPRVASFAFAICLHTGALVILVAGPLGNTLSLSNGEGSDALTVVASVSLEGADVFTQSVQEASVDEAAAKSEQNNPIKKEEPKEIARPDEAVASHPSEEPKKELPDEEQAQKPEKADQTASVAANAQDQQIAAAANAARRSKLWSAYSTELYSAFERSKKKPRPGLKGDVLLAITIAPSGELLKRAVVKSSGNPELDQVALASVDRAAPFSPIPPDVSNVPLTLTVPFQYRLSK